MRAKAPGIETRRRPELGALHRVVRENLLTLYAASEQGFASALPKFVKGRMKLRDLVLAVAGIDRRAS